MATACWIPGTGTTTSAGSGVSRNMRRRLFFLAKNKRREGSVKNITLTSIKQIRENYRKLLQLWILEITQSMIKKIAAKDIPCEQWFLQAGRCAMKRKKPLRANICFAIEHARPRGAYVKTPNDTTSCRFLGTIMTCTRVPRSAGKRHPKLYSKSEFAFLHLVQFVKCFKLFCSLILKE